MVVLLEDDLQVLVESLAKYGIEVDMEKHTIRKNRKIVYLRSNVNLARLLAVMSELIDEVKEEVKEECKTEKI
jgi:hypothetical protein